MSAFWLLVLFSAVYGAGLGLKYGLQLLISWPETNYTVGWLALVGAVLLGGLGLGLAGGGLLALVVLFWGQP
ncbi:hypothetical protein ACFFLM_19225 [Deinococcus oregonensis]|uniref:Uncharacterized protein n=1 Tax=Deinococcus oregonensis TaxID=1805970 RepID=A0ABV6B2V0_9DEIO